MGVSGWCVEWWWVTVVGACKEAAFAPIAKNAEGSLGEAFHTTRASLANTTGHQPTTQAPQTLLQYPLPNPSACRAGQAHFPSAPSRCPARPPTQTTTETDLFCPSPPHPNPNPHQTHTNPPHRQDKMEHSSYASGNGGGSSTFTGEAIPLRRDIDTQHHQQPKTLNEMETELHSLHKENFDLKMTIYYQKNCIESLKGGDFDLSERQRDLEEHISDLEYRMQEKDARLEELEAFLAQHHAQQMQQHASRDLKDEMRQVSSEAAAAAAAEAQETLQREKALYQERLRDLELRLARERTEKEAAQQDAAAWQDKVRGLEETKGMLQRELDRAQQEARRALEQAQEEAATAIRAQQAEGQQQQQQQLLATSMQHQKPELDENMFREYRLRALKAEERVQELEVKVGHYQAELREVGRAQQTGMDASVWKESLEAARRELQHERGAKETAVRKLEQELQALLQEKAQWRQGERGAWDELTQLRDQLAAERRAKDALLLDMSDIRRHGKQQLRDLLGELREFDRSVESNFAELFETAATAADDQQVPITTPLKQLLAAEEDAGRRRGLLSLGGLVDPSPTKQLALALEESQAGATGAASSLSMQASGKLMVRQAQDLVRKWRLKLQVLPSLNHRFRDATAQTVHAFEARLAHMTERLAAQERQVHEAQRNVEHIRAGRAEAEEQHARELERAKRTVQKQFQDLLAQVTAEKNALAERLSRVQAETSMDVQEAMKAARREAARHQAEDHAALQALREEVAAWAKRCETETADGARLKKEKEGLGEEKRRMQVEMDRLLHQLTYRDDVIAVFKEALETHGLDKLPNISAQLALLQRHMAKKGGAAGSGGATSGGQRVADLVRQGLEQAAEKMMTLGAAGATEHQELLKRAEELKVYGREAQALVTTTKDMLERYQHQRAAAAGASSSGRSSSSYLVQDVAKLLQDNARVAELLRGLYLDLQRLVQKAAAASSSSLAAAAGSSKYYGSPLRRAAGGGGVRSPYASPTQDRRRKASFNNSSSSYASPMHSRAAEELLLRSASSSHGGGGGMQARLAAAAAAATGASPGFGDSSGGGVLGRHQLHRAGGKPMANLEKISHDLMEIAEKLEHIKTVGPGGAVAAASLPSSATKASARGSTSTVLNRLG